MNRTLVYSATCSCIVYVGGQECPSDREWREYVDFVRRCLASKVPSKCLVLLGGGYPSSVQRELLNAAVRGYDSCVAVLMSRVIPAEVQTAYIVMSWFIRGMRRFDPDDLSGALDYLQVEASKRQAIGKVLADLRMKLREPLTIPPLTPRVPL